MTGDRVKRGLLVAWALYMVLQCVGCAQPYWMPIVYDPPGMSKDKDVDAAIADAEHWTGDASCIPDEKGGV